MLISIATTTFDPDGARTFPITGDSALGINTGSRRVSMQATLDGGALFYDTGYSVTDRLLRIQSSRPTKDLADWFSRLVRLHTEVRITTPEGSFLAIPVTWSNDNNTPTIELRLKRQIQTA